MLFRCLEDYLSYIIYNITTFMQKCHILAPDASITQPSLAAEQPPEIIHFTCVARAVGKYARYAGSYCRRRIVRLVEHPSEVFVLKALEIFLGFGQDSPVIADQDRGGR